MNVDEWLQKGRPYWPLMMLFCVVLTGALRGVGPALLVLSASLLVLGVVLAWMSLGELTNEEPLSLDEALELAAPERREQEKLSILRALKDLEQEHRFGKITDDEFAAESARMRHQAKRMLASFDDSIKARRARVEERISKLLKTQKPAKAKRESPPSESSPAGESS
jgi:hypothetical protein